MVQEIYIQGRGYRATALYVDGKVVVKAGSQLKYTDASGFKQNPYAFEKRNNSEYVSKGVVIKDCDFSSPSTAAQFITGGSRNGYDTWKVRKGYSLGDCRADAGIRQRKKRNKESN